MTRRFIEWSNRGFLQVPQSSNIFRPILGGVQLNCEIERLDLDDSGRGNSSSLVTQNHRTITQIHIGSNSVVSVDGEERVSVDATMRRRREGRMVLTGQEEETYFAIERCKGKPTSLWAGDCIEDCWLVATATKNANPRTFWRTSRIPAWGTETDHAGYPPIVFFDGNIADGLTVATTGNPAGDHDVIVPEAFDPVVGAYGITTLEPASLPAGTRSIHLRYPALWYVNVLEVSRSRSENGFEYSFDFEEVLVT